MQQHTIYMLHASEEDYGSPDSARGKGENKWHASSDNEISQVIWTAIFIRSRI
jgi:hypothetical protein